MPMPDKLTKIFESNESWADKMVDKDPDFFQRHTKGQKPEYLWIGCSDSRVPVRQMTDTGPGEMFVHLNIANTFHHHDLNALSVLHYAVDVLEVRQIIVCGHYACGGVMAALEQVDHGLVDHWIRPIKQLYEEHKSRLNTLPKEEMVNQVCEWHARRQAFNVAQTSIVQRAWQKKQELTVHAIIYNLENGLLNDLDCHITGPEDIPEIYHIQ